MLLLFLTQAFDFCLQQKYSNRNGIYRSTWSKKQKQKWLSKWNNIFQKTSIKDNNLWKTENKWGGPCYCPRLTDLNRLPRKRDIADALSWRGKAESMGEVRWLEFASTIQERTQRNKTTEICRVASTRVCNGVWTGTRS